jgi:hypothetical protein
MSEFVQSQDEPGAANEQRPLSKEEQAQISAIRDLETEFIALCNALGVSRDLSLAITYCEDASMRAIRHVTSRGKKAASG